MQHLSINHTNHVSYLPQLKWLLITILFVGLYLYLPQAMAQAAPGNPLENIKIAPGQKNPNDFGAMIKFFVKLFITALPFIVLTLVMLDSIVAVFQSVKDARKDQEWGKLFGNLFVILIGLGFAIFVGYLLFVLLSYFEQYWKF